MPKKKTASKKTIAKKATTKKKVTAQKKTVSSKTTPNKKTVVKKSAIKKTPAKKTATKKSVSQKTTSKRPNTPGLLQNLETFIPYKIKKGEEYMNEDQIQHFKDILNEWKHALMEEVDRTVHHMQDEAANFPDPNDRATQESEFTMELRARDRERKLIKKIDESLANLDTEDYGYCELCGIEIGVRRLEARPTASMCIDCKTLEEIREKQMS